MLGEKPYVPPPPLTPEEQAEEARRFEEQMYWEDYYDRNADESPKSARQPAASAMPVQRVDYKDWLPELDDVTDKEPF